MDVSTLRRQLASAHAENKSLRLQVSSLQDGNAVLRDRVSELEASASDPGPEPGVVASEEVVSLVEALVAEVEGRANSPKTLKTAVDDLAQAVGLSDDEGDDE